MNAFLNRGEYGLLPYLEVKTVSAGDKQVIKLFHLFDCCDMFYCFLVIFSFILSWTYSNSFIATMTLASIKFLT